MAAEVFCGRCGAHLVNPAAPCPRCGAPASGGYYGPAAAIPRARKSPGLAAALAVLPGLGHFYLGQNIKGFAFLVGVFGLQFFGFDLDLTVIPWSLAAQACGCSASSMRIEPPSAWSTCRRGNPGSPYAGPLNGAS